MTAQCVYIRTQSDNRIAWINRLDSEIADIVSFILVYFDVYFTEIPWPKWTRTFKVILKTSCGFTHLYMIAWINRLDSEIADISSFILVYFDL